MSDISKKDLTILFGKWYAWVRVNGNLTLQRVTEEEVQAILEN